MQMNLEMDGQSFLQLVKELLICEGSKTINVYCLDDHHILLCTSRFCLLLLSDLSIL